MQVFPANTMAQFTTLLPHRIELAGDWEVAILEASWPAKVKNITSAAFTLSCFDKKSKRPTRPKHNGTIPDGYYPNVDILMTKLIQSVYQRNDTNFPVSWKVDPVSGKIEVFFHSQELEDQFWLLFKSSDLSNTLGITDTICCTIQSQLEKGYAVQGTYPVDLQGGRHTMFILRFDSKRNLGWRSNSSFEGHTVEPKRCCFQCNMLQKLSQIAVEKTDKVKFSINNDKTLRWKRPADAFRQYWTDQSHASFPSPQRPLVFIQLKSTILNSC